MNAIFGIQKTVLFRINNESELMWRVQKKKNMNELQTENKIRNAYS